MSKKHSLIIVLVLLSGLVVFSYFKNTASTQDDIVLTINGLKMSREEFKNKFSTDMEYDDQAKNSDSVRKQMLEVIIRKELLIQEAIKKGLDQDTKFMAAIERYWEATLIKQLMEQKNQEIQKATFVPENEIRKKYNEYKKKNSSLPSLETVKQELTNEILAQKKAQNMEKWMESLRNNAKIEIADDLFNK